MPLMRDVFAASSSERGAPLRSRAAWTSFAALGVVFGDLGTSPLYTLQTVVQATGGHFTASSALGVLSAIFWTLIITISVKYCLFVMRADNHGEGGILALMALLGANGFTPGVKIFTGMGLLGAALIYGDGAITPAISVLSALEGINVVTSAFKPFVMPATVVILLALFAAYLYVLPTPAAQRTGSLGSALQVGGALAAAGALTALGLLLAWAPLAKISA